MESEEQVILNTQSITQQRSFPFRQTSLEEVTSKLPRKPPCRVFFKNEFEQPSHSFKLRGIGYLINKCIAKADRQYPGKEIHVFASSGGNAGLAAAYSAKFYGVKCTVVLPVVSKPQVRTTLESYGARTVVSGRTISDADQHVRSLIECIDLNKTVPIYCHPYEHPLVWQGHSSLVDEVIMQLSPQEVSKIKGFVCSVGGGGLYNGIHEGLKNHDLKSDILLMETNQAPTLKNTIKADKVIRLSNVNSVASSLACSYVPSKTLLNFKDKSSFMTRLESIDDTDAMRACVEYYKNTGLVTEPACGASLSVIYNQLDLLEKNFNLKEDDIIIIVVCGGSCSTLEDIKQYDRIINRLGYKL